MKTKLGSVNLQPSPDAKTIVITMTSEKEIDLQSLVLLLGSLIDEVQRQLDNEISKRKAQNIGH